MTAHNFSLIAFDDLTKDQINSFFKFCKEASLEKLPAAQNMWQDDWENRTETLPFILNRTDRFKTKGQFHILFDNDNVVLCGGVYISDFSKSIAIAGTRTWVNKQYRHKSLVRDYLLPFHKKWAIEHGSKQIVICFNEYNKALKKIFFRSRLGESGERLYFRTEEHLFFSNINEPPFPVNIQDTAQWILYEKLDPNWEFDWNSIKANVPGTL